MKHKQLIYQPGKGDRIINTSKEKVTYKGRQGL